MFTIPNGGLWHWVYPYVGMMSNDSLVVGENGIVYGHWFSTCFFLDIGNINICKLTMTQSSTHK